MQSRTLLTSGLILLSAVTHAAGITLDEALRQARSGRDIITSAQHRVKKAEAEAASLGAHAPLTLAVGASSPTGFGPTDQDFSLQQGLDLSGARSDFRRIGSAKVAAAKSELKAALVQVQTETIRAYIEAWAAKEVLTTTADIRVINEDLLRAAQRRVQEGLAPEVQAIRAELELERARMSEASSKSALKRALKQLAAAIGVAGVEDVTATTSLKADASLEDRPDLLLLKAQISAARAEESAARKLSRPEAALSLHRSPWAEDSRLGLRLQFTWNLLDGGKARAESKAAEQERLSLERAWQDKAKLAEAEASLLEEEIRASQESHLILETLAQDLRTLTEKTKRGFEEGVGAMVEVLESLRSLREAEMELANSERKVMLLQVDLLQVKGALLEAMK